MTKVLESGVLFNQQARGEEFSLSKHDEPGHLYIDHSRDGAMIEAGNGSGYASIEIPVEQFGRVKAKLEQIRQSHEGEQ